MRKKLYRHAMKLYRPQPYKGDALVVQRSNEAIEGRLNRNSDNEWRKIICGRLTSKQFHCEHMGFLKAPLVTEVTSIINQAFGTAVNPPTTPID